MIIATHLHSEISQSILPDSPCKTEDYLKELDNIDDLNGFIITNHGNALNWYNNKKLINGKGLKYIHAVEGYCCLNAESKGSSHILLYAMNLDGFYEINKLISLSYKRDGHFYNRPRMFMSEILSCENIIISSACSAGVLKDKNSEEFKMLIDWGKNNRDKFFLEIQPHSFGKQKEVNSLAIELSELYNLRLIATNDVHYTNKETHNTREILQANRNMKFEDEDECDLSLSGYDKMISNLIKVGIDENIAKNALLNTNILYDTCNDFEVDESFKYPQIYDNPKMDLFKDSLLELKNRGISDGKYMKRVIFELSGMEKLGNLSYIKLFSDWLTWCKQNGIQTGSSRGSSSGSLVCDLTNITNIDPIEWGTSWDRFLNIERVSLSDKFCRVI